MCHYYFDVGYYFHVLSSTLLKYIFSISTIIPTATCIFNTLIWSVKLQTNLLQKSLPFLLWRLRSRNYYWMNLGSQENMICNRKSGISLYLFWVPKMLRLPLIFWVVLRKKTVHTPDTIMPDCRLNYYID